MLLPRYDRSFARVEFLVVAITAFVVAFCVAPAFAHELQVGVAVEDITPPVGYRISGYFHERLSTAIHDPLHAKALVFQQGRTRAALVVCDLSGLPQSITARARDEAAECSGIPAENIAVIATHTHTGPLFYGPMREKLHALAITESGSDSAEAVDYPAIFVRRIADAVARAAERAAPVELLIGAAQQSGLSFNRRFQMKDGAIRTNPGKLNPDVIKAVGPTDADVPLLLVKEKTSGRHIALLYTFAMHLDTVGGTEYSADYPYYVEQSLRQGLGPELVAIYTPGTCGDLNHYDVSTNRPQHGHAEAQRIGDILADTIRTALDGLKPISEPDLAVVGKIIQVPAQQYDTEKIAWARQFADRPAPFSLAYVEAHKILSLEFRGMPKTLEMEVQAFRLSPRAAIVTLPGEVFVELGLAIKKGSGFEHNFVVELANDAPHYIPTLEACEQGSYEVTNSIIAPGGGELLVETAAGLLKRLEHSR